MQDILGSGLLGIFTFLLVMSSLVVIHELGHYWAGRFCGVHAEVFSIGFGPKVWGWRDKQGTEWQIAALPLGGYVRFLGDENAMSAPDKDTLEAHRQTRGEDADKVFHFKPLWQRAFIVVAGPLANFVLAIVIFTGFGAVFGEVIIEPRIGQVIEGQAAEEAGFQAGDRVVSIDGQRVESFTDLLEKVAIRGDQNTRFVVERQGEEVVLDALIRSQMRPDPFGGERRIGFLGIALAADASREVVRVPLYRAPLYGVEMTGERIGAIVDYIGRIITGRVGPELLNGPVGIATAAGQITNSALSEGEGEAPIALSTRVTSLVTSLLYFAGVISVGLGLMNLLPIPMLDGGHLVYYAYEAITQRPPSLALQEIGFKVGLVLVLGMLLVATWNDLGYLHGLLTS